MASNEYLDDPTWDGGSDGHGAAGWQAARRHSRLVRTLRIGLPVLILLIVAVIFLSLRALPSRVGDIELGDVGLSGSVLTMEAPSLTGFGSRGMTYEVDADRALQDLTQPNVVRLEGIHGRLRQPDGGWTLLTARSGIYDGDAGTLRLDEAIDIETHDGRRAYLIEADVDLENQSVISERPVRIEMTDMVILADRLEVREGGDRLLMSGGVRVQMNLGNPAQLGEADDR